MWDLQTAVQAVAGRGGIASGAAVDTAQIDKTPLRWTIPALLAVAS